MVILNYSHKVGRQPVKQWRCAEKVVQVTGWQAASDYRCVRRCLPDLFLACGWRERCVAACFRIDLSKDRDWGVYVPGADETAPPTLFSAPPSAPPRPPGLPPDISPAISSWADAEVTGTSVTSVIDTMAAPTILLILLMTILQKSEPTVPSDYLFFVFAPTGQKSDPGGSLCDTECPEANEGG